jgi:hypothetical protein
MPFPVLLYNNARMEPRSNHYWLLYGFVFSLFLAPPHVHNLVPCPRICIRSSCVCHVKRFEKIPHYHMHDVTVSAAVTSFEFLVSEIFNGNTPPKTYKCQKKEAYCRIFPHHFQMHQYNDSFFRRYGHVPKIRLH